MGKDSKMQDVCTWLVEENAFIREGLRSLLAQSNYNPEIVAETKEDLPQSKDSDKCELVIMGVESCPEGMTSCINAVKKICTKARIIILASEVDADAIKACFTAGADGFMLKNISTSAFLGSLDLVMMGEKVFPTSMASMLIEENTQKKNEVSEQLTKSMCGYDLSEREFEIVQCLTEGGSNKEIARKLNIAESTVKVHLKTILRKLGLSNRTQAAIWAITTIPEAQDDQQPQRDSQAAA